ncbi:calcium/sodium antiporter [Candidatus Woesearchaeota archaeon]|nr:calcium/sodium antiporter [Candidatus Woesearchaeota archaeon]
MVFTNLIILIASIALLIKSSDYFVKAAASLARRLGVSEFIIGLTFVAVGTSLPELASSITASFLGQDKIIIGNVVGSNIANIGLILGITAIIAAISTRKTNVKMDGYLMIFAALLLTTFAFDRVISRIEAIVFLVFYGGYIIYLFEKSQDLKGEYNFKEYLWYILKFKPFNGARNIILRFWNEYNGATKNKEYKTLLKNLAILTVTGLGVVAGAHFTIVKASLFAELLGINKEAIGIILIAVGTSLPELSVSIAAARLGRGEIAMGNIVGSNIANILLVLGTAALIRPVTFGLEMLSFVLPTLIFISLVLLVLMWKYKKITRTHGLGLVAFYALFLLLLIMFVY